MNHKAIYALYPNVVVIDGNNAYDENKNQVEIDIEEVNAWVDPEAYKLKRRYPSLGDQLDMLWHAIDTNSLNKTSDFYTAIKAVKDAHPKE
jgi:hypothetical protein